MKTSRYDETSFGRRFGSGALVLLLHLLLLLALLHMVAPAPRSFSGTTKEIFFQLVKPARPPAPAETAPPLPVMISPSRGQPQIMVPPITGPVASPDLRGLGQSLFGCAPEALAGLTLEQRSRCTGGLARPDDTVVEMPRSHVKDPQRRAAEMRAKNTPGRIPCAIVMNTYAPGGGGAAPGVDPLCIIDGLLNGFGPLNGLPK